MNWPQLKHSYLDEQMLKLSNIKAYKKCCIKLWNKERKKQFKKQPGVEPWAASVIGESVTAAPQLTNFVPDWFPQNYHIVIRKNVSISRLRKQMHSDFLQRKISLKKVQIWWEFVEHKCGLIQQRLPNFWII